MGMKCWKSTLNAQGSRLIILDLQVVAVMDAQSQQIFEQVTNKFLERITAAQQLAPTANHDNEVTKQLVKEVVEESGGKWVDVVKKMGKQMDNFVSQGEARECATCSCNARIIRFDETEGETAQQLLDKVNSQVL